MKQHYLQQKSFFEFAGSMMIILRKHMHQKNHTPMSRATITRDMLCNIIIYWRIRMKCQIEIIVRICTLSAVCSYDTLARLLSTIPRHGIPHQSFLQLTGSVHRKFTFWGTRQDPVAYERHTRVTSWNAEAKLTRVGGCDIPMVYTPVFIYKPRRMVMTWEDCNS